MAETIFAGMLLSLRPSPLVIPASTFLMGITNPIKRLITVLMIKLIMNAIGLKPSLAVRLPVSERKKLRVTLMRILICIPTFFIFFSINALLYFNTLSRSILISSVPVI